MPTIILEEKRRALSPREAERTLGISHATLYRLIKAGRLRTINLGSRTIIPIDAIDALWTGREMKAIEIPARQRGKPGQ